MDDIPTGFAVGTKHSCVKKTSVDGLSKRRKMESPDEKGCKLFFEILSNG